MPIPPIPMGGGAPGGPAPGGPPGAGGVGLPKSPIGGPSGPGSSPMVSPGTGAGMQAAALKGTAAVIQTLMGYAKSFEPGTPEFNGFMRAITALNAVSKKTGNPAPPGQPIPVGATPPGAGVGGLPAGGAQPPGGAGGGAMAPMTPAME